MAMRRLRSPHDPFRSPCSARCSRPPAPTPTPRPTPPASASHSPSLTVQRERRPGRDHDRAQRHERGRPDPLHHARRRRPVRPSRVHRGRRRSTSTRSRACSTSRSASPARRSPCRSSTTASQSVPKTIQVSLFGPSPIGMASPSKAVLTILEQRPRRRRATRRTPSPSPVAPSAGNPLSGASFFVDPAERGGARRPARTRRST